MLIWISSFHPDGKQCCFYSGAKYSIVTVIRFLYKTHVYTSESLCSKHTRSTMKLLHGHTPWTKYELEFSPDLNTLLPILIFKQHFSLEQKRKYFIMMCCRTNSKTQKQNQNQAQNTRKTSGPPYSIIKSIYIEGGPAEIHVSHIVTEF